MPARKMPARKLLATVIAGALFLPTSGFTLGLGEIEVNSALNQKLSADIELLSATPEDTETIIVKLASRKEFARAGIDRPFLLSDLRFKPVVIDGVPHIKISSGSPIREPYLNFLLEVDWPNGHLLREYTVLLDPPTFMMQPASAVSAPVGQNNEFRPAAKTGSGTTIAVAPGMGQGTGRPAAAEQARPAYQPAAPAQSGATYVPAAVPSQQAAEGGQYRIKSGDTAWSLANAMRPDQSVTVEQMMIAMLRANPESFINENVNGLKRGYILRIPDYNQITSISHAEARALVREQAALWRQLSRAQSGGEPVSAMPGAAMGDAGPGASGAADESGRLAIVSAGEGSSALGSKDPTEMTAEELRAELALARERVETERVEKEALLQRISQLEQSVNKMKGMLSIEDDSLSEVQELGAPAAEGDQGIDTQAEQELQEVLSDISEATVAGEAGETADLAGGEETAEAEMPAETGPAAGEEEAVFSDEVPAEQPAKPALAPEPAPQPAPIVSRQPQDPLSRLLNDPLLLAGGGGALLLLLILIGLIVKKRKQAAEEAVTEVDTTDTDSDTDLTDLADDIAAQAEAEETVEEAAEAEAEEETEGDAGDEFDSDATMILDAQDTVVADSPEALVEEPEEPRDDVIAEADVYLAYGIYQQAEELLTQAIAEHPDRDDYRVKLAETYYASKNVDEFVKVAEELHQRAEGNETPAWKKVLGMGQDLCPDNPMFQGSMVGGLDVDALAPKAPEMDIDLGGEDAGDEAPDLDLSLDEEPLELPEETAAEDETQIMEALEDEAAESESVDELEFDISDTGAVVEDNTEDEFSLDIDATELDIDIQDEEGSQEEEQEENSNEEESFELDDVDIGLDLDEETSDSGDEVHALDDVDIDFGLDDDTSNDNEQAEETAEAEEEEISLDLTEEAEAMDLDLSDDTGSAEETEVAEEMTLEEDGAETEEAAVSETGDADSEAPAAESADDDSMEEEDFDLNSLDDVDEISTKLDLARAYLDMGDHEGARGILEEVQADGSDEQKQEAAELMEKLD